MRILTGTFLNLCGQPLLDLIMSDDPTSSRCRLCTLQRGQYGHIFADFVQRGGLGKLADCFDDHLFVAHACNLTPDQWPRKPGTMEHGPAGKRPGFALQVCRANPLRRTGRRAGGRVVRGDFGEILTRSRGGRGGNETGLSLFNLDSPVFGGAGTNPAGRTKGRRCGYIDHAAGLIGWRTIGVGHVPIGTARGDDHHSEAASACLADAGSSSKMSKSGPSGTLVPVAKIQALAGRPRFALSYAGQAARRLPKSDRLPCIFSTSWGALNCYGRNVGAFGW